VALRRKLFEPKTCDATLRPHKAGWQCYGSYGTDVRQNTGPVWPRALCKMHSVRYAGHHGRAECKVEEYRDPTWIEMKRNVPAENAL
jgi:hypothetical protein